LTIYEIPSQGIPPVPDDLLVAVLRGDECVIKIGRGINPLSLAGHLQAVADVVLKAYTVNQAVEKGLLSKDKASEALNHLLINH
jgi:hypothetical protein